MPLFSLLLASLLGGAIVALLKENPGEAQSLREALMLKLDLITYTYQLLYSPLVNPSGFLQSLLLATPSSSPGSPWPWGLGAGSSTSGPRGSSSWGPSPPCWWGSTSRAPGGSSCPWPSSPPPWPGALGAIPGWLKARFGAHEVINTIMFNYIAASLFLFLISANEYKFFGKTLYLPFKYPGYEARSYEIRPEARIPHWTDLVAPGGELSFALPLALLLGVLGYFLVRKSLGHRVLAATLLGVLGYGVGGFFPAPRWPSAPTSPRCA